MNLDELIVRLQDVSADPVVADLAKHLAQWKDNGKTTEELRQHIERFIGNTWIQNQDEHSQVYALWSDFRDKAIHGIEGMTMNERLYYFGLLDRFDACEDDESRLIIYTKLHASP